MRGVALVAITVAACSAPEPTYEPPADAPRDARPDAFVIDECWPEDVTPVPRGSVTLGIGEDVFVPLGSELEVVYGPAGGYFLPLNARMTGLVPGDPTFLFDPHNPRTRVRAFFADSGQPLMRHPACFRSGYIAGGGGFYEMSRAAAMLLDSCWRSSDLIGQRIRVELEVIDAFGGLATDVRTVTMTAPPIGTYPNDEGAPGCDAP